MTTAYEGDERLVTVRGRGVGETANAVVKTAQECGYSVAASGPGQFRMIREKRPTWAVVAAILTFPFFGLGLLFLLVKKTDSGSVAVFEGRDGTKVRFVGGIDQEVIDSVSAAPPKTTSSQSSPAPNATKQGESKDAKIQSTPRPHNSAMADVAESVNQEPPTRYPSAAPASPAGNGGGTPALIDSSPIAKDGAARLESIDPSVEMTVARPMRQAVAAQALAVAFPDGRSVELSNGLVIGRSPLLPEGMESLSAMSYPDTSLSKTHLMIESSGTGVVVTDLHSTNGTVLVHGGVTQACSAGTAVRAVAGAEIHAGDVRLLVEPVR